MMILVRAFSPKMMHELDGRLEKIQMLMHMYAPFWNVICQLWYQINMVFDFMGNMRFYFSSDVWVFASLY
jgi:hypothetical protein